MGVIKDTRHEIRYQKKCAVCDKEFGAWNNRQKFCCEACKRKNAKKYYEAYKHVEIKDKAKKNKGTSLEEIDKEARKAGMTYGQYVAMMKL